MPFLTQHLTFIIVSALFGLFIAAYIALTSIVLVDICGIEKLTSSFGLLTVFRYERRYKDYKIVFVVLFLGVYQPSSDPR